MKKSSILVIKQVSTAIKGLQYFRHFIARASALPGVSHYLKIRAVSYCLASIAGYSFLLGVVVSSTLHFLALLAEHRTL